MKVVIQQAVAVEFKRLPLFQLAKRLQEGIEISLFVEDVLTVVATVNDVVDQAIIDRA